MKAPGYWMNETSGVLRPAVLAYLNGDPMTAAQIAAMRAYLRQWMERGDWRGERVQSLSRLVHGLDSREAISNWLTMAEQEGIDPL